VVDSWRRYKRDLTAAEDRPAARWSVFRPKQVSQSDLLIPVGRDRVKLFAACLFCGAGLSVLWVYFPLLMVSIALNESFGAWLWIGMAGFGGLVALALFAWASANEKRYWESL
jgi:hypothetical protein